MAAMDALIRVMKGLHMSLGFMLFGAAMTVATVTAVPFLRVVDLVKGRSYQRMQSVNRAVFSFFLGLLRCGRLIRELPATGRPLDGPCVIVANHPGLFDVLFLLRDLKKTSVLVKPSLFSFMGPILRASGYVRGFDLRPGVPSPGPLREARRVILEGYRFIVFPEGTRSPEGRVLPFSSMAADLARKAGVPLQPVAIRCIPPLLSHEQRWYHPPRATSVLEIEYLDPVPAEGDRRQVMERVRNEIIEALGTGRLSGPGPRGEEFE